MELYYIKLPSDMESMSTASLVTVHAGTMRSLALPSSFFTYVARLERKASNTSSQNSKIC